MLFPEVRLHKLISGYAASTPLEVPGLGLVQLRRTAKKQWTLLLRAPPKSAHVATKLEIHRTSDSYLRYVVISPLLTGETRPPAYRTSSEALDAALHRFVLLDAVARLTGTAHG